MKVVIPAKAGISAFDSDARPWTPAFAGVTGHFVTCSKHFNEFPALKAHSSGMDGRPRKCAAPRAFNPGLRSHTMALEEHEPRG